MSGWWSGASTGSKVLNADGSFTGTAVTNYTTASAWAATSNQTLYARYTINTPGTTTISGGATKIYGASDTTLTCSNSTSYATGVSKYYSFGYAASDGGTPSNWTTASTSNTLTVSATGFTGSRWYSCRVYASDGTQTSSTSTSATTADTKMTLNRATITFNANGGTLSGDSTLYVQKGSDKLWDDISASGNAHWADGPTVSKSGATFAGWYTADSGGSKVLNTSGDIAGAVSGYTTADAWDTTVNRTLYAQFTMQTPATPTISGGATKVYGSSATTLTCATSTTYGSGISKYYSFGYATSDGGTPSNWTTASTTATLSVAANAYVGQRWYSCRVYASDGNSTSETSTSATTADTEMTINNATLTFNATSNGGTGGGTVYTKTGATGVYAGIRNTTAGSIPSASKTGWTMSGWYSTQSSGGSKVLNADGSFTGTAVTNYTTTNAWATTANQTLYARYTINTPGTTTISGGATKIYGASATTLTCSNSTSYASGTTKYYQFGYATSNGGTPGNWTTASSTNTLTISSTEYVGQRWYSCRVYASDGTSTSSNSTSATNADTEMTINNATLTFNATSNGGTGGGTVYTKTGATGVYTGIRNTTAGSIPSATAPTGYTMSGWYSTQSSGGSKVLNADGSFTGTAVANYTTASAWAATANQTLYARYTINTPGTTTISGGATKIYGASATTLTCSNSTSYASGTSKYYSFGYAASDGGTPSAWTTASTSNTLTISATEYVGNRWYSCRVYASDGTQTSSTSTSATTADTQMTLNSATITFNANGGTLNGTSPLYARTGGAKLWDDIHGIGNAHWADAPTASLTGAAFAGWYTAASGGSKVLNTSGDIAGAVSGYTTAEEWSTTVNRTLYAQYTLNTPATPTISGGATKIYGASATTLTCATSTTYGSGISKYYSFGYATSDGGTPGNWTTASTTNTISISATSYVGQRWYSCRVYASDGTNTSETSTSATTADTEMTINNATLTFNATSNGGTGGGTVYTKTGVDVVYNGIRSTTTTSIPSASKTGWTFNGWYSTQSSGGSKVLNADGSFTGTAVSGYTTASAWAATANQTLYARYTINTPGTTTISGGATKIYGASATTLTCSNSTSYASGTTKYYQFGYATSDGGTPGNWTTASTTNTLSISATSYVGQRWYSCRVYASDGTSTSSTSTSATNADTEMTINNATLTFNATSNGGTGGGTVYTRTGATEVYTGIRNSTSGSIPSASKTGWTMSGWYSTASSGGSKVLNADGSFTGTAVANYTTASAWAATSNQTLYARYTINTPGTTTISGGTTKIYGVSATTLTCSNSTSYASGTTKYYQFGYTNSSTGTPGNWTTASTSNTLTISATEYVGKRWYSCRVYASDGTTTSSTATSTSSTQNVINNATITFNANGGVLKGASPLYTRTGASHLVYSIDSTQISSEWEDAPTALNSSGYTFKGWYTASSGGNKVLNADGSFTGTAVSGYTTTNTWVTTVDRILYAQFETGSYTLTLNPNGGTYNSTTSNSTKSVTYGSSTNSSVGVATRSGYTFKGWYDSVSGGEQIYDSSGDAVFGAYWSGPDMAPSTATSTLPYTNTSGTWDVTTIYYGLGYTNNKYYYADQVKHEYNGQLSHDDYYEYRLYEWSGSSWIQVYQSGGSNVSGGTGSMPASGTTYYSAWNTAWGNRNAGDHGASTWPSSIGPNFDHIPYSSETDSAGWNIQTTSYGVGYYNDKYYYADTASYTYWGEHNYDDYTAYRLYEWTTTSSWTQVYNERSAPTSGNTYYSAWSNAWGHRNNSDHGRSYWPADTALWRLTSGATAYARWEKNVTNLTISYSPTSYIYDGDSHCPTPTVKDGSTTLTSGVDYTYTCGNNTNVGTANIIIAGRNVYNSTTKAFYAGFTPADSTGYNFYINNVALIFNATENGGTGGGTVYARNGFADVYDDIRSNSPTSIPTATPPANQSLTGWYTASSGGSKVLNANGSFTGTAISGYTTASDWAVSSEKTLYAQYASNVYTVTLNNQSATTAGTTTIYEKYGNGFYLNSSCTTQMTTSTNPITKPTKTGYTFYGYYTSTGGGGTQYIDKNGKLTSSASNTHFTNNSGSLYAYWKRTKLTVTETVKGNQADTSKDFTFTINVKDNNGNNISGDYAYTGSKTGNLSFTSGNATFTLHHNQYIEVYFPTDWTYTITQSNGSYTLTKTNDSGTFGNDVAATFTDTLSATAPTGLFLDILPYIILLVISVGTGTVIYKFKFE